MTTLSLPSGSYRAGSLRQSLATRLQRIGHQVWASLERMGERRAARYLQQFAQDPVWQARLREAGRSQG